MRLTIKTNTNDYYIPVKKGMLMAGYVDKLGEYEDIDESPKHLAKVNKALEAIKRNPILIISLLTNNATYKHVVDVTNESERPTQEEWDLLREVLL